MLMVMCIFYFHFCDIAEVAIIHNTEFESQKKKGKKKEKNLSHFWLQC
jgi:hypothetical protein